MEEQSTPDGSDGLLTPSLEPTNGVQNSAFHDLMGAVPIAILTVDRDRAIRSMNRASEKLFGYETETVAGEPITRLLPAFDTESLGARQAITDEEAAPLEVEGVTKSGYGIVLELTAGEIVVDGETVHTITLIDITNRKAVEEELKEQQLRAQEGSQRLSSIMNSVLDAVISTDVEGNVQSFNTAAERMFGYSVVEAVGKNVSALMPEYNDYIKEFLETGEMKLIGAQQEVTGHHKDGSMFPIELSMNWMEFRGDFMIVAVCRNITRRKREEKERAYLERELQQAQKLESLGTLAGGIAHEINTPVQYVGDNIRFLRESCGGIESVLKTSKAFFEAVSSDTDLEEAFRQARTALDAADVSDFLEEAPQAFEESLDGIAKISEIVQAIKEFSHPATKEMASVDINHLISMTATMARNQWKYVAALETDFDESLPTIQALSGELSQVVLNLLVNAAQAIEETGEQGAIFISTQADGDWIEIRVRDTGTGIPAENLERVFEPFFTTKEPGKGTGQGLSISHTIVTLKHGGAIAVESPEGEGCSFIIRLPVVQPPGAPKDAADGEQTEAA